MKKYLFYSVFTLINLVLFEVILTLFDPEAILVKGFDKEVLFRMYPDKSGKVSSREYSVTVKTNRLGFRQEIGVFEKFDILAVGDSFTEGWGVEENEVYTSHINAKKFRILNLGLHGSSPALFALQIPHYIKQFKPKKIIVQLFDNDLDDNDKIERFLEFTDTGEVKNPESRFMTSIFGERIYNFLKQLTLYRLFVRAYKFVKKEPSPILYYKIGREPKIKLLSHHESLKEFGKLSPLGSEINTKYGNQFGFYKDSNELLWKERFRKNEIYLKQIVKICKGHNVEISFLYIPAKEFFAKRGILGDSKTDALSAFNSRNPHYLQVKALCDIERLNCHFVTDLFWGKDPESLFFPYDAHLNKKGHKILAEELEKRM